MCDGYQDYHIPDGCEEYQIHISYEDYNISKVWDYSHIFYDNDDIYIYDWLMYHHICIMSAYFGKYNWRTEYQISYN